MKRLIEKIVFSGLVIAWRLATWRTSLSPVLVNATTDGVVRPPSSLAITVGSPPSMTATTEFVVPRSMPIVLPILRNLPRVACGNAGSIYCRPLLLRLASCGTENNSSVERMEIRRLRLVSYSLQARGTDTTKVVPKSWFRGWPNPTAPESRTGCSTPRRLWARTLPCHLLPGRVHEPVRILESARALRVRVHLRGAFHSKLERRGAASNRPIPQIVRAISLPQCSDHCGIPGGCRI